MVIGGYDLSGSLDDVELVDVDCTRIKTVGNCSTQLSPLPEPTGSAAGALDYSGMKHFENTSFILGGASTLVRCFVNSFLKDPLLCLGSREAAEQLWNYKKTFYKTSLPRSGPS